MVKQILQFECFSLSADLCDFVNDKEIKKKDIQEIITTTILSYIYYWKDVDKTKDAKRAD